MEEALKHLNIYGKMLQNHLTKKFCASSTLNFKKFADNEVVGEQLKRAILGHALC